MKTNNGNIVNYWILGLGVICIIVGAFWEPNRNFLVPIGLLSIVAIFVLEKFGTKKVQIDLESMDVAHEKWLDLIIHSSKLLVADNWDLKAPLIVEQCPNHVEVNLTLLENLNFKVVKAVSVKGRHSFKLKGTEIISVDSGWLFFGDSEVFGTGVTPHELERRIEKGFDRIGDKNPLLLPIPNKKGELCGFVIATGLGDGRYELKQVNDGDTWKLVIEFL